MKEKTFSDMVEEEIISTMMNDYDYEEEAAKKFAILHTNMIEGYMWTVFDNEIAEMMSKKLNKQKEKQ